MNLGASAIVLRPRPLAEILDLACRLSCSLAFELYLRLAALVLLPCLGVCLALRHGLGWEWPAVWAVAVSLGVILQGVFTVAVGRLLFSETLSARQVLALYGRRLGSYLGALFLSRLVLAAAALPFFLGLPLAWPRLFYVHEASLLEGAGSMEAMRRSSRFSAMNLAGILGALLAVLCAQAGFVVTAELLGDGLVQHVLQLGRPFGSLFTDGGSAYALLGFFLSMPYVATARFLLYIDARTRADGWDVQLRFMAIAARAAASAREAA